MNQASAHAQKLAAEHGIDLNDLTGTGNEGLITKADVENFIGRGGHTNIMEAQKAAREAAFKDSTLDEVEIALPSQEELLELIKEMKGEIETLRNTQADLIDRDNYGRDLTDDMFFIAKAAGHKWEERRIINKKTVLLDFVGTAFYGPFAERETIDEYLKQKRRKREDSYLDWENVKIMTGREARALDRQEKEAREAQFATQESPASLNVLDRRIWEHQGWGVGSETGVGQVVGPAE